MRKEGHSPTTLQDAVRTARIIEAAAESSESGRFVKVKQDSSFPA
jgi:predicted dehydrogenase